MTKYRTFWQKIDAVDVEKESDCFVWINGRRNAKLSSYECYFDTFDDAKAYLRDKAERKVAAAQSTLDRARNELAAVLSLQPNAAITGISPSPVDGEVGDEKEA